MQSTLVKRRGSGFVPVYDLSELVFTARLIVVFGGSASAGVWSSLARNPNLVDLVQAWRSWSVEGLAS